MTTKHDIEDLIERVAELPDEAQAELFQSLVEMRAQHLGIYHLDDDERLGRFASDDDTRQMFARYGV